MSFSIIDQNDNTTKVPISTTTDAAGKTAVNHVIGYVVGNVATLVDSAHPLPMAGTVTQAGTPWTVSWSGQTLAATQSGPWTVDLAAGSRVAIDAASLPLPSGAATSANQPAINADGGALTHVVNLPAIQPVSAASLPLPSGAATSANQPAINADGGALTHVVNLPAIQVVAGSVAVGSAPAQPPLSMAGVDSAGNKQHLRTDTFGVPSDAAWSSGPGSLVAVAKAIVQAAQSTTAAVTSSSIVPPTPTFTQTSAASSSLTMKASAGSVYAVYATTGTQSGYLMLFDSTTVPPNGAVTPKHAIFCGANSTTELELPFLTAEPFASGIMAVFSSTGPFTLTASATAFMKGIVQ